MKNISDLVILGGLDPSSNEYKPHEWMSLTMLILTGCILAIYLPMAIIVVAKMRKFLDCSSKLILFAYTLAFILRFIKNAGCYV